MNQSKFPSLDDIVPLDEDLKKGLTINTEPPVEKSRRILVTFSTYEHQLHRSMLGAFLANGVALVSQDPKAVTNDPTPLLEYLPAIACPELEEHTLKQPPRWKEMNNGSFQRRKKRANSGRKYKHR